MKLTSLLLSFVIITQLVCTHSIGEEVQFFVTGAQGDGLLPGNIDPPTSSNGSGGLGSAGIVFDTDSNTLSIDILWGSENGFTDLTGEIILLHLHGPTPSLPPDNFGEVNPDIIVNLGSSLNFNSSPTNGGLTDEYFLSNEEAEWLLAGRTYINVHTDLYEFGEIRGYVLPVNAIPEPATAGLFGLASLVAVSRRRRVV